MAKASVGKELAHLGQMMPEALDLDRPLTELTPTEALGRVAFRGLQHLDALLSLPVATDLEMVQQTYPKAYRLIGDMAIAVNRLLVTTGEAGAAMKRDKALEELIEVLAQERREKLAKSVG